MAQKVWFVHLHGEVLGPLLTDTILLMLKGNRLQFTDFIWTKGITKWTRIFEIDPFAGSLPQYPGTAVPWELMEELEAGASGKTRVEVDSDPDAETESDAKASATRVLKSKKTVPESVEDAPPKGKKTTVQESQATARDVQVPERVSASAATPVEKRPAKQVQAPPAYPKVRRFERVPISAKVKVIGLGEYPVTNISEGGMFVKADSTVTVGSDFKVSIQSEYFSKPLDMTGVVIRIAQGAEAPGFGFEFTRVNPAHRRAIHEYVKRKLMSDE